MTSLEAEAAIQARGGIAAAVRTRDQWLASDMGRAAREGPWIALAPGGRKEVGIGLDGQGIPRAETPLPGAAENIRRPLTGVRVLDLTRVIAGPVNQRRLQELLKAADVVVTGYRHGSLDRFGLGADALQAFRPGLAVVTLDSWGAAGPWRRLRGFDSIVQAAAGIAHAYGRQTDDGGWQPGALPVQALDHATGYGAAAAAITLLTSRRRTGRGGAGRLSLARTAEELCALPAVRTEPRALPEPAYRNMPSTFGGLRYVPPPLAAAGQPLDYSGPPPPYGSSGLAWT
ncbi:CoA transferase [Arthrobacter sp. MPF02]|uniref:CoA transferase n=1 Tax=Arthrobacter sp. MPF02 TaxID=3388492 RepID=UPI0039849C6B